MTKPLRFIRDHVCPDCGSIHDVELPKYLKHLEARRSRREHNILFGYIGLCCDNWPEQYEYQPKENDPEHLRAWVLIRVGHCKELVVPAIDPKHKGFLKIVAAFAGAKYFETTVRNDRICILSPKSISTGKGGVDRKTYNRITNSIAEVLEPICGISIEDYKENKRTMSPAEEPAYGP